MSKEFIESVEKHITAELEQGSEVENIFYNLIKDGSPIENPTGEEKYQVAKLAHKHKATSFLSNLIHRFEDDQGNNILHYAMRDADIDLINLSLKTPGVMIDDHNKDWKLPIQLAPENKRQELAGILEQHLFQGILTRFDSEISEMNRNLLSIPPQEKRELDASGINYRAVIEKCESNEQELIDTHDANKDKPWWVRCQQIYDFIEKQYHNIQMEKPEVDKRLLHRLLDFFKTMVEVINPHALDLKGLLSAKQWDMDAIRKTINASDYFDSPYLGLSTVSKLIHRCYDNREFTKEQCVVLKLLLSKLKNINKDRYTYRGGDQPTTLLLNSLKSPWYFGLAKILVENGADIHSVDLNKNTIVHRSINNPKMLKLILENFPSVAINAKNAKHRTPLDLAIKSGQYVSFVLLYLHGAKPNTSNDEKKSEYNYSSGDSDALKELMKQVNDDKEGNTLLHIVAKDLHNADKDVIDELALIDHSYFGMKNKHGKQPLELIKDKELQASFAQGIYKQTLFSNLFEPLNFLREQYLYNDDSKRAELANTIHDDLLKLAKDLLLAKNNFPANDLRKMHDDLTKAVKEKIRTPEVQATDLRKILYGILAVLISLFVVTNVLWAIPSYRNTMWNTEFGYKLHQKHQMLEELPTHLLSQS